MSASTKCEYCQKTVYHAEEQRFDGKTFHIQCMGKYKKESQAEDLKGRNITYEMTPDVQPAYYRVADTSGVSRMESGSEYKVGGSPIQTASSVKGTSSSPSKPPSSKSPSGKTPSSFEKATSVKINTSNSKPAPVDPVGVQRAQSRPEKTQLNVGSASMYLPGADSEKAIKAAAALGEPAWKNAGKVAGVQIWRVEKFQIKEWPIDQYGYFFDGDSYIVLNSYGHPMSLRYNVHFWLGKYTTQDEAGTAAYKTVELDDYLGGLPVQYREVQGFESDSFLNLFDRIIIQNGGIESGFRHVEPEKYRHRLLHIKGTAKNLVVREVPKNIKSLNSGDVFILDEGTELYQFVGKTASTVEKSKASKIMGGINAERKVAIKGYLLEEGNEEKDKQAWTHFWSALGGKGVIAPGDSISDTKVKVIREMYKVSDASGKLTFSPVQYGRSSLQEDDAFVVNTGPIVFVWIGKRANATEKKSAFIFAQQYLNDNPNLEKSTPIVRVLSGSENEEFNSYLTI